MGETTLRHFLYHPTEVFKATEQAPEAYISDLLIGISCIDPCFPWFISPLSWSSWHHHPNELFVFRISVWETLTQILSPYSYIPLSKPDDLRMHSDPGNLTLPFSHSSTAQCFSSHFNNKLYTTMKPMQILVPLKPTLSTDIHTKSHENQATKEMECCGKDYSTSLGLAAPD